MKIVEELYYHSSHNPRYVRELKTALRDTGIMPPQEPKTIHLGVKENIKETNFWKNGFIFVNERVEADRSKIKDINDIDVSKNFGPYNLRTGFTEDRTIFVEELKAEEDKTTRQFELKTFNESIIRKAISKLDFYRFDNLQKYFPGLNSINEFIESLKQTRVDIRSSKNRLIRLTPDDKLEVCLNMLNQLESQTRAGYTDHKGTKLFVQNKINEVVRNKTLNINVGDYSDQEFGIAMSQTTKENLRLNLSVKDWYVYDENYGTSEEKQFIQFINGAMERLKEKYSGIYLLRNANLFKIYRFSDGRPTEPDFVLFLKEKDNEEWTQYQLFIEAKGNIYIKPDQWKEDFLKEIEGNYKLQILYENEKYKLIGMPFYNQDTRNKFVDVFNDKLSLN